MKSRLLILCLIFLTLSAGAVPALKKWRSCQQTDGNRVDLLLVGDENLHYYMTTDGLVVLQNENGDYVYACLSSEGFEPTTILAHNVDMRTSWEKAQIATFEEVGTEGLSRAAAQKPRFARTVGEPTGDFTGSKKGLVIMVEFSDVNFTVSKQDIEDMVNKEGYTNSYGAIGSVHDYFSDMSDGQFDLSFNVVGPVKLDRNCYYYGYNSGRNDSYNRLMEFVRESVLAAADSTDFSLYDWDGDGYVEQVFLLYAGYGEATGGHANTIWPHESSLWSPLTIDGVKVSTYACSNELNGSSGTVRMGLGVFCHEFSHCLGLPDFYDTSDGGSQYGMDMWDVMASGSYNGDSWIPAAYTGYERNFCGWRDFNKLNTPCEVEELEPIGNGGETYQIVNPGNENEYYLLENRHGGYGWDKGFYTNNTGQALSGLMIYHVTYDADRWALNKVNATGYGYQCMTPVHADCSEETVFQQGQYLYINGDEYQGDLFPYRVSFKENHNTFSDTSTPQDVLNTPNKDGTYLLHTNVINIRKQGRFCYFDFEGIETPENYALGDVNGDGTVNVTDVMLVVNYVLGDILPVFHEECSDINGDGRIDIADIMGVVNIILHQSVQAPAKTISDHQELFLQVRDRRIDLMHNSINDYTAFQMDVQMPEGVTLFNVELDGHDSNHSVMVNDLDNGLYRIVVFSLGGYSLKDNRDDLLISLVADKPISENFQIRNIQFTNSAYETVTYPDIASSVTSIERNELKEKPDGIFYNLQGMRIYKPLKGVFINNAKDKTVKAIQHFMRN